MYACMEKSSHWLVTGTQSSLIYSRTMHRIEACPRRRISNMILSSIGKQCTKHIIIDIYANSLFNICLV